MRIVHLVRSDAFYGVERYIATLARAQAEMGDDVAVIGGSPPKMLGALEGSGVEFAGGNSPAHVVRSLRGTGRADILHAHMTEAELLACLASRYSRQSAPVVSTRHFAAHRGASKIGGLTSPFIARTLAFEIAISEFVSKSIEHPAEVVYPGVRVTRVSQVRREPTVLVAQRLETEKQSALALRAFANSGLVPLGWILKIAGDGSQRTDLQLLSSSLKINAAVEFLGRRDDVPALMASSAVFMATAPAEPFGLSVVEAMGSGLPVVAAAAGGHLETLAPEALKCGFPAGDAQAAGVALRNVALNEQLRTELSAAGLRRHAQLFTPGVQARRTRELYQRAVARRQ